MIAIRTDANQEIAMGHVMRCLSIATQIKNSRRDTLFIISDVDTKEMIECAGFKVECLNNAYNQKDNELDLLLEIIERYAISHILVDSYEVSFFYLESLSKRIQVTYMDDLMLYKYPVNQIVNYSYGITAKDYQRYSYDENVTMLLGSKYVPLRHQFSGEPITINEKVQRVLVTTGGSDPYHMTPNILLALKNAIIDGIFFDVIVGTYSKDLEWLLDFSEHHKQVNILQSVSDMATVMRRCDLAISAGGTTLSELCACGVPTIAFSMADNQIEGAKSYAEDKLLIYVGDIRKERDAKLNKIVKVFDELCASKEKRQQLSSKGADAIDGRGAERIACAIIDREDL